MSIRARLGLVVLWVASLAVVAPFARTQVLQTVPLPTPTIVSGSDFGFRIEGTQGATPVGRLVVRRNGQLVEVAFGTGVPRVTAR
jgi:hypothetical protein